MKRYYFNLSCETIYKEDILIGIDAFDPEDAERQIDLYVNEDNKELAREFLVTNRELVGERDYDSITLVEHTDLEENDNDETA